ncbi:MAG: STAS domain-containing protein [Clostridia bacterium]|nr:STAS domain-containing protein [Clostridia bacterium]
MKIKVREYENYAEVIVDGNILQENVGLFRNRLNDLIEKGSVNIVINLAATVYISSLCLSVIINTKGKVAPLGGDLKIVSINKLVHNLLQITNLIKKLEIYESIESAVSAFDKKN